MTLRIYSMPISERADPGAPDITIREPKYLSDFQGKTYAMIDYGSEPTAIIRIDVDTSQHATLTGYPDVLAVPQNIDGNPQQAAVATIQNFLESLNIPAGWVNENRTWRQIVRVIGGVFRVNQRYWGIRMAAGETDPNSLFRDGVDLSRTFSSLPAQMRADLQQIGQEFGIDFSGVTGSSTLREILTIAGFHFAGDPLVLITPI